MSQTDTSLVRRDLLQGNTVFPSTVIALCDEVDKLRQRLPLFGDIADAVCPNSGLYARECECWRGDD